MSQITNSIIIIFCFVIIVSSYKDRIKTEKNIYVNELSKNDWNDIKAKLI